MPLTGDNGRAKPEAAGVMRTRWVALLASASFHLLLAIFLLLGVRSKPQDTGDPPLGTVELVMVEKKGSAEPPLVSPPPVSPPSSSPSSPSDTEASMAGGGAPVQVPPDTAPTSTGEPRLAVTQPSPATPPAAPPPHPEQTNPATSVTEQAPVFHLEGTDSESNTVVFGDQVLPARQDDRFRNREPIYPYDAVARGQHGAVLVVIHISENGFATGVDVVVTSGVASLDRAVAGCGTPVAFPTGDAGRT